MIRKDMLKGRRVHLLEPRHSCVTTVPLWRGEVHHPQGRAAFSVPWPSSRSCALSAARDRAGQLSATIKVVVTVVCRHCAITNCTVKSDVCRGQQDSLRAEGMALAPLPNAWLARLGCERASRYLPANHVTGCLQSDVSTEL